MENKLDITTSIYADMQRLAAASNMTINDLAKLNGCASGYELQEKIRAKLESTDHQSGKSRKLEEEIEMYKAICKELEKFGITKSVVGATTVDGAPAVLLRWNGAEEYVTATHFALGTEDVRDDLIDEAYIAWLQKNFK